MTKTTVGGFTALGLLMAMTSTLMSGSLKVGSGVKFAALPGVTVPEQRPVFHSGGHQPLSEIGNFLDQKHFVASPLNDYVQSTSPDIIKHLQNGLVSLRRSGPVSPAQLKMPPILSSKIRTTPTAIPKMRSKRLPAKQDRFTAKWRDAGHPHEQQQKQHQHPFMKSLFWCTNPFAAEKSTWTRVRSTIRAIDHDPTNMAHLITPLFAISPKVDHDIRDTLHNLGTLYRAVTLYDVTRAVRHRVADIARRYRYTVSWHDIGPLLNRAAVLAQYRAFTALVGNKPIVVAETERRRHLKNRVLADLGLSSDQDQQRCHFGRIDWAEGRLVQADPINVDDIVAGAVADLDLDQIRSSREPRVDVDVGPISFHYIDSPFQSEIAAIHAKVMNMIKEFDLPTSSTDYYPVRLSKKQFSDDDLRLLLAAATADDSADPVTDNGPNHPVGDVAAALPLDQINLALESGLDLEYVPDFVNSQERRRLLSDLLRVQRSLTLDRVLQVSGELFFDRAFAEINAGRLDEDMTFYALGQALVRYSTRQILNGAISDETLMKRSQDSPWALPAIRHDDKSGVWTRVSLPIEDITDFAWDVAMQYRTTVLAKRDKNSGAFMFMNDGSVSGDLAQSLFMERVESLSGEKVGAQESGGAPRRRWLAKSCPFNKRRHHPATNDLRPNAELITQTTFGEFRL